MDYSKVDPLKDAIKSNYAHGKQMLKVRDDYRNGKISFNEYNTKMKYHTSVIEEQNKWRTPLNNLEKKVLYAKAKK
ncbi:MAG: hypothetical protein K6E87_04450 [bacterium]|nr:hypothetical protein [bacterium]